MSADVAAQRPARSGRALALWLGFLLLIAAAVGLAWIGAGSLRPVVTQSGLRFQTVQAGKGERIGHADAALLDYILTTDDGNVVDGSDAHGGAQRFYMDMPNLFPGFAEAMAHMQEGGEYRFTMPPSLAFPHGTPEGFPKNSNLTFEVRVRKVVRGGAAMLQQLEQMQAQQQMQQQQQGGQRAPQP